MRGPQWDYSTAQYMVDKNSVEYRSGVELEPPPKEPTPEPVGMQDLPMHVPQVPQQAQWMGHQSMSSSTASQPNLSSNMSMAQQQQQLQLHNAQMMAQQQARAFAQMPAQVQQANGQQFNAQQFNQMQAALAAQQQQMQASIAQSQSTGQPLTPQQIAYIQQHQQQEMLRRAQAMQQQQQIQPFNGSMTSLG